MNEDWKKNYYGSVLDPYMNHSALQISLADLISPLPPKPPAPQLDLAAILASIDPQRSFPISGFDAFLRGPTTPVYLGSAEQDRKAEEILRSLSKGPGVTEQQKCERAESAVRAAIAKDSILASLPISVFRQGSYRAETNIGVESDVDICVYLTNGKFVAEYPSGISHGNVGNVSVTLPPFPSYRLVVEGALQAQFGDSVKSGSRAFDIKETTKRVEADVLPAYEYRWYYDANPSAYYSGICFLTKDGTKFHWNYPEHAFKNGQDKDSFARTHARYKQVVRILKALRARMEGSGIVAAKDVASFLIESMVYNVDDSVFRQHSSFVPLLRDVLSAMYSMTLPSSTFQAKEVNGIKFLFSPVQQWTRQQANAFVAACWRYIGYT